jgi:hypothetical protein
MLGIFWTNPGDDFHNLATPQFVMNQNRSETHTARLSDLFTVGWLFTPAASLSTQNSIPI